MPAIDREALVQAHSRFPLVLTGLLEPAPDALLREREAPGRWSPLEILVHLRDEEVEDFRARAQATVEGRAIFPAIDPEGWVASRGYNRQEPAAVLADFRRERAVSCEWLCALGAAELERAVAHVRLGTMRAADFIAAWRMHDLLHLGQLATALARLTARRLEGHRIDYAGRLPEPPA